MNVQLVITRVILFAGLSIGGWVAVFGGIADMRKADRRRRRTTGRVVEIATRTERRKRRVNRSQQHRSYEYTVTLYNPVLAFNVEGREYRLKCLYTCLRDEVSVGETVDILYEDDRPQQYRIERVVQRERKGAAFEISIGIAWIIASLVVTFALLKGVRH